MYRYRTAHWLSICLVYLAGIVLADAGLYTTVPQCTVSLMLRIRSYISMVELKTDLISLIGRLCHLCLHSRGCFLSQRTGYRLHLCRCSLPKFPYYLRQGELHHQRAAHIQGIWLDTMRSTETITSNSRHHCCIPPFRCGDFPNDLARHSQTHGAWRWLGYRRLVNVACICEDSVYTLFSWLVTHCAYLWTDEARTLGMSSCNEWHFGKRYV